jgi:IS30 family transposase
MNGLIIKSKNKDNDPDILIYSATASEYRRMEKIKSQKKRKLKIDGNNKLIEYIKDKLSHRHSLKVIAGRLKAIGTQAAGVETLISAKTLYNYVDHDKVEFINRNSLKLK